MIFSHVLYRLSYLGTWTTEPSRCRPFLAGGKVVQLRRARRDSTSTIPHGVTRVQPGSRWSERHRGARVWATAVRDERFPGRAHSDRRAEGRTGSSVRPVRRSHRRRSGWLPRIAKPGGDSVDPGHPDSGDPPHPPPRDMLGASSDGLRRGLDGLRGRAGAVRLDRSDAADGAETVRAFDGGPVLFIGGRSCGSGDLS